jgi:hypothetical protein
MITAFAAVQTRSWQRVGPVTEVSPRRGGWDYVTATVILPDDCACRGHDDVTRCLRPPPAVVAYEASIDGLLW